MKLVCKATIVSRGILHWNSYDLLYLQELDDVVICDFAITKKWPFQLGLCAFFFLCLQLDTVSQVHSTFQTRCNVSLFNAVNVSKP